MKWTLGRTEKPDDGWTVFWWKRAGVGGWYWRKTYQEAKKAGMATMQRNSANGAVLLPGRYPSEEEIEEPVHPIDAHRVYLMNGHDVLDWWEILSG
jgi:hypothetical protein